MQGGWGAQHRSDIGRSFLGRFREVMLALMFFGDANPRVGSKIFQIVDPVRAMAHFPAELETVSRKKPRGREAATLRPGWPKRCRAQTGNPPEGKPWRYPTRSSSPA